MDKTKALQHIAENQNDYRNMARAIWEKPELAWNEVFASNLQREYLKQHGFTIKEIEGLPTAFMATYGNGSPVIGLLGEYDALPGLSQDTAAMRKPVTEGAAGHGCGHNLIGVGCVAAAVAVKAMLEQENQSGTVRYFGCPAEEGGGGKAKMIEKGAFEGTEICLTWHPESVNKITEQMLMSIVRIKINFKGISSVSLSKRNLGGNTTYASELMTSGIHQLEAQAAGSGVIGYHTIKSAAVSNVLPEEYEMSITVRGNEKAYADLLAKRIKDYAKGAAMMTATEANVEIYGNYESLLYNEALANTVYENMKQVGCAKYSKQELEFTSAVAENCDPKFRDKVIKFYNISNEDINGGMHIGTVKQEQIFFRPASDVGNVSQIIPTAMFFAAITPLGQPLHTWQAASLTGSDAGFSGMLYASEVLTGAICDLINSPQLVEAVKEAYEKSSK